MEGPCPTDAVLSRVWGGDVIVPSDGVPGTAYEYCSSSCAAHQDCLLFSLALGVTDSYTGEIGYRCTAYSFGGTPSSLPRRTDSTSGTCYFLSALGSTYQLAMNEYR